MGNPYEDDREVKKKLQINHPFENTNKKQQERDLKPRFAKPEFSYIDHHRPTPIEDEQLADKVQTSLKFEMPTIRRYTELSQAEMVKPSSKYIPARERVKLKHVNPPKIYTGFVLEKREKKEPSKEKPKPTLRLQTERQKLPVSNQVIKRWRREETRWNKLPNHYITIISILGNRRKTPFMIMFEFNNIQVSLGKEPLKQAEIMDYLTDMRKKGLIKSYGEESQSYWYRSNKTEGLI